MRCPVQKARLAAIRSGREEIDVLGNVALNDFTAGFSFQGLLKFAHSHIRKRHSGAHSAPNDPFCGNSPREYTETPTPMSGLPFLPPAYRVEAEKAPQVTCDVDIEALLQTTEEDRQSESALAVQLEQYLEHILDPPPPPDDVSAQFGFEGVSELTSVTSVTSIFSRIHRGAPPKQPSPFSIKDRPKETLERLLRDYMQGWSVWLKDRITAQTPSDPQEIASQLDQIHFFFQQARRTLQRCCSLLLGKRLLTIPEIRHQFQQALLATLTAKLELLPQKANSSSPA